MFDDKKLQVEQSFPRTSYKFFGQGFRLIDEVFHHTDGFMYYVWVCELIFRF